jgi:hypothetical protein
MQIQQPKKKRKRIVRLVILKPELVYTSKKGKVKEKSRN